MKHLWQWYVMLRHAMQETAFVIHNVSTCSVEILKSCTFKSSKSCFNSQLVGVKPESYFVQLAMACAYFDGLCAKQLQHSLLHAKPLTTHEDPGGMFWSVNDMPLLEGFWTTMIVKQFTRRWPLLVVGELIAVIIWFFESSNPKALRAPQLDQTCQRAHCWNSSRQPPSATLLLPGPIPKLITGLASLEKNCGQCAWKAAVPRPCLSA